MIIYRIFCSLPHGVKLLKDLLKKNVVRLKDQIKKFIMLLVEEEEHCITFWIDFVNLKTNYPMYRGGILNEISELLINRSLY